MDKQEWQASYDEINAAMSTNQADIQAALVDVQKAQQALAQLRIKQQRLERDRDALLRKRPAGDDVIYDRDQASYPRLIGGEHPRYASERR